MRSQHKAQDAVADNDVWYDTFADITFDTHFSPLSKDQGRAYLSHYRHRYCRGSPPTTEEVIALQSLENVIDTLMSNVDNRGAFVRLNSRSPKDAIALDKSLFLDYSSHLSLNEKLQLYFDLGMKSLCVHSGKQAVELLLSSERIFVDIFQAFDADEQQQQSDTGDNKYEWNLKICVRQWEHNLREDLEFRAFVSEYEMIALSQYNTYVLYPHVIDNKDIIYDKIKRFYDSTVKSRLLMLNLAEVVVDIALIPLIEDSPRRNPFSLPTPFSSQAISFARVVIVELNPYNRRTGGGLFTWCGEKSLNVSLEHNEVDFRLVTDIDNDVSADDQRIVMLDYLLTEGDEAFTRMKHQRQSEFSTTKRSSQNKCSIM